MFKDVTKNDVIGILADALFCAVGGAVMGLFRLSAERKIYREEVQKRLDDETTDEEET